MVTVLCLDIEPETLARLQRHRRPPLLREADSPAHLIAALEHDPTATEAVLLGQGVDDPLRLVHYAHALDPDLALVMLASADTLESLREALEFVPSLRGDVGCARADDVDALATALEEAARRTQKRRIFRTANSVTVARLEEAAVEASLTAPFLVRLLDHAPVGVVVLNSHGRVQLHNPSAIDLLLPAERALLGRSFVLLFPEAEWERLSHHLARCSATERRISAETFRCAPPPERSLAITAAPFPGAKGERGTLVFLQDRTSSAQHEPLEGVDRRVRDAERLSGMARFGGDVAQRFQGHLAAIVGSAESMQETAADPSASRALEFILDEGQKALAVAGQLLTFAGRKSLRFEPVELSDLVRRTLESVEDVVPKRIALRVDLAPALPTVLADVEHVRAILENLVRQAVEAIGSHAGEIAVSSGVGDPRPGQRLPCGAESDPMGPCVYLEVADDARDKDASSRLQAFDRRSASRAPGADLALAAVLGAVRSQGGSIEVGFPARGGTAFRVLFPLDSAAPSEPAEELQGGTILLFSPEQGTHPVTHRILERYGLTVHVSSDIAETVELLRSEEHPVDALLLDADLGDTARDLVAELEQLQVAMPVVPTVEDPEHGDELRYGRLPRFPVILVSEDPAQRETAGRVGLEPAAFLQKPFTVELLIRTVRGVLQGRKGGPPAERGRA